MIVLFVAMLVYAWLPKVRNYSDEKGLKPSSFWTFFCNGGGLLIASWCFCLYVRYETGRWSTIDILVIGSAIALWPIIERGVHRYQMHRIPGTVFNSHAEHHRCPYDPTSGITPEAYSGLIWAVSMLFWGRPLLSTFLVMLIGILLFYDWIHYLIHTAHKPRTRWGRAVVANHRRHHFKDHDKYNGLLFPWGDQ